MAEIKSIVAKNIAELRTNAGMTQIDLAVKLNYSDKAVSKWERGESLPDIAVLMEITQIFGVTLDYLVEEEHVKQSSPRRSQNHALITLLCLGFVWLLATACFVALTISSLPNTWMAFVYATVVSSIVHLVLNCVWFGGKYNELIISVLMWCILTCIYLSLLVFGGHNLWLIFILGAPGQLIILFWSKIRPVNRKKDKNDSN